MEKAYEKFDARAFKVYPELEAKILYAFDAVLDSRPGFSRCHYGHYHDQ